MGLIILAVLLVYIIVSIALAVGAHFLGKKKGWKWCSWWVMLIVMVLIPTWDIPIGWAYFNHLCDTEAGMFVYKNVSLPDQYFWKEGERNEKFSEKSDYGYAKGGELKREELEKEYRIESDFDRNYSRWGHIFKRETTVSEHSGGLMGKATSIYYRGGWLMSPFMGEMAGSNVCPANGKPSAEGYIHAAIFTEIFNRQN